VKKELASIPVVEAETSERGGAGNTVISVPRNETYLHLL